MNSSFKRFLRSDIEQSIPSRFEHQVDIHPHKPAVFTPDLEWTYTELNSKANAVAKALISTSGHDSVPVCLLMDQGAALVCAILGILKAGKFYVPLEPSHPLSTNAEIANSSGAIHVIAESNYFETAKKLFKNPNQILHIEKYLNESNISNLQIEINPQAPAYIFFTSGTSGKPKGVVDNHRNILHNISRYTNALKINSDDRLTMIQSATFSGTVSSLFCALLNGAAILPFDFRNQGFEKMASWIKNSHATIYHSVPSIFRGLVATGMTFPKVRFIRLEGDKSSIEDLKLLEKSFHENCRIAHGLGATETGLSCQYISKPGELIAGEDIPIGYPLPDIYVRIIDAHGTPVSDGEIGEIEICSEFLAMGYWNNSELTNARFITDSNNNKVRHFRTGDLGKRDANGSIFYIGRKDLEYKINGQFVAVNDAERALLETGLFKSALVITRKEDVHAPRLVAYVILKEEVEVEITQIRKLLEDKLPENSIPTAIVTLTTIPLTEHGKVDRNALPPPKIKSGAIERTSFSEEELAIISIWEEALNVSPIDLNDNFFNLGGSSLSAALIAAKLEQLTGRLIPPTTMFVAPTIEEFLQLLRNNSPLLKSRDPLIALHSTGNLAPIFMVDFPGGMGWHYKRLVHLLGDDQPFYCLTSSGMLDPWPSDTKIEDLAYSVVERILTLKPKGPIRLAGNCFGGVVAFEAARQLKVKHLEVEQLILLSVSPKEFSTLLPHEATRKYQKATALKFRKERMSKKAKMGIPVLLRFVMNWIIKKFSDWIRNVINKLFRKELLLISNGEISSMSHELVMAYSPVKSEINTLLILTESETKTYTTNPLKTWAGVANKIEVLLLHGSNEESLNEPAVNLVADGMRKKNN